MVYPAVSISGDSTVRHPFRISCLLRPHRLSGIRFGRPYVWTFRSWRSAVRGCPDVDLRHAGLSSARGNSQRPAALAAEFPTRRFGAIGIAWPCSIAGRFAALGGHLAMATEPILAALDVSAVQGRRIASSNVLFDYWELTKPEINFLDRK